MLSSKLGGKDTNVLGCLVAKLVLCDPMDCSPDRLQATWTGSSVHGDSPKEYWSGLPRLPSGDLPSPGIEPRSPALQADSLPAEPPGKPMNTGVDSLSLLQGNFPTLELNPGLLHCRSILYQLSYQGSPKTPISIHNNGQNKQKIRKCRTYRKPTRSTDVYRRLHPTIGYAFLAAQGHFLEQMIY